MRDWKCVLAAFALLLSAAPVAAEDVEGLYQANVPVVGQGGEERAQALGEALAEVLVKLTGRGDISAHPGLQAAFQDATRYVQQFRYLAADPTPERPSGQVLAVRFDPAALTDLLRANNLPLWGRARPATLLWLAVERRGRRELIGANTESELAAMVAQQAQRRGLPVQLPLLDLTDQSSLRPADVWGGFEDSIARASARYQTEAVLVGRVYASGGTWHGRWSLFQGETREHWDATGEQARAVIDAGVDGAASRLAQRFAQVLGTGVRETLLVEVHDVRKLADYTRAVSQLESLSPVQSVRPAAVAGTSATFRLEIRGGRDAVAQAVRLGRSFAALQEPAPMAPAPTGDPEAADKTPVPDLVLRLLP